MRIFLNAINNHLMLRSAPFETPPAAAPQDRQARLEARTVLLQRFLTGAVNFLTGSQAETRAPGFLTHVLVLCSRGCDNKLLR
jgi:hypothetical protein